MTEVRAVILHAVHQEHRHLDPVDVGRAGARGAISWIRAQRVVKVFLTRLRAADVAEVVHDVEVVHADVADRALVPVGRLDDAHQRRVAAVGRAVDADAVDVGDAGAGRPQHAVLQVVLHLEAPVPVPLVVEVLAVAARAAVVDLEHGIAGVGERGGFHVVAPAVADAVRTAVRQDDQWQLLRRLLLRQRQVADQFHAVPGLEPHRLRPRHVRGLDLWARIEQVADLAVVFVPEVELPRIAVAVDAQHVLDAVRGRRFDRDLVVRKRSDQPLPHDHQRMILLQRDVGRIVVLVLGGDRHVVVVEDDFVDVDPRIAIDQLPGAGLRVDPVVADRLRVEVVLVQDPVRIPLVPADGTLTPLGLR